MAWSILQNLIQEPTEDLEIFVDHLLRIGGICVSYDFAQGKGRISR